MAVFQPQNVNLSPAFENIQRAIEKGGEAKAAEAGNKYKVIQAGVDAVSKVANYYLMKKLDQKLEDDKKKTIDAKTWDDFGTTHMGLKPDTPEFKDWQGKREQYRLNNEDALKLIQETGTAVQSRTAFNELINDPEFGKLSAKTQKEIKLAWEDDPKGMAEQISKQNYPGQNKISQDPKSFQSFLVRDAIEKAKKGEGTLEENMAAAMEEYKTKVSPMTSIDPSTGLPYNPALSGTPGIPTVPEGKKIDNLKYLNPIQNKSLSDYRESYQADTKDLRGQLSIGKEIRDQITTNPRAGIGASQTMLTKYFGEVRPTDEDVKRIADSQDVVTRFLNIKDKYLNAKYSDITVKDLTFLLDISEKAKKSRLTQMAETAVDDISDEIPNSDRDFLLRKITRTAYGDLIKPEKKDNSPKVGDIVDGYEFVGGQPSDSKNWRKKK